MDLLRQFQSKCGEKKVIIAFQAGTEDDIQETEPSEITSTGIPETPSAPIVAAHQREIEAPPRRLYMDVEREEIIAEILRLERKHIQEGLHYDRVRYLGDNTLNRRKEFLLDYLYSLCDHFENYTIGIHDLAERQAIREYEREVSARLKQQKRETFSSELRRTQAVTGVSMSSPVCALCTTEAGLWNADDNGLSPTFLVFDGRSETITNKRKHFDFLPEAV